MSNPHGRNPLRDPGRLGPFYNPSFKLALIGKALSVADQGYVLQKGRIIAQGTAQALMGSDMIRKAYFCQTEG